MGGADGVRGAIDGLLATTGAQLGVLKKHCPATFREIRAAVRAYKGELEAAVTYTMGVLLNKWQHEDELKKAKAKLRRMRA
jgi:hypothetical protein